MIRINLLPVRAQIRKENVRQQIMLYFLSVALVLAGIGLLWVTRDLQVSRLDSRSKQLQKDIDNFAKYEKILKDLQTKKETIENKRRIVQDLQKDRDRLVRVLALLSVEIPADRVWFDKLVQSGNTVTVDGIALSNETLAEFMRNLESSPYVDKGSVNLVHSRLTTMGGMKLREFRLSCNISPFSIVEQRLKETPQKS